MNVTMDLTDLRALLIEAGEIAATKVLIENGLLKQVLSKSEASKRYGRQNIELWLKEGLIDPVRDNFGSFNWRLDRLQLDALSKADNRHKFINTKERK